MFGFNLTPVCLVIPFEDTAQLYCVPHFKDKKECKNILDGGNCELYIISSCSLTGILSWCSVDFSVVQSFKSCYSWSLEWEPWWPSGAAAFLHGFGHLMLEFCKSYIVYHRLLKPRNCAWSIRLQQKLSSIWWCVTSLVAYMRGWTTLVTIVIIWFTFSCEAAKNACTTSKKVQLLLCLFLFLHS